MPVTTYYMLRNVTFLLCMVTEIFLYCWYGEEIKMKNSEISQALYDTNWYEAEISEMKTIIIMMERCKKPIQLKVGGVLQLSYDSFILILKKSYSFLTVLRQIYSSHQ